MLFRFVNKIVGTTALLGVTLSGCNDLYTGRRDTLSLVSGDAMAVNRVTHMVDPWSPASGKRNIAYNGELAGAASERYRTGRVIPPRPASTNQLYAVQQQGQQSSSGSSGNGGGSSGSAGN